jgi:hypothetical protein
MRLFKFFRRREMQREITLIVRGLTYSEPTTYEKNGSTRITTNPFLIERDEIEVKWKLDGKRDDLRVGQSIRCSLTLIGADEESSIEPPPATPQVAP